MAKLMLELDLFNIDEIEAGLSLLADAKRRLLHPTASVTPPVRLSQERSRELAARMYDEALGLDVGSVTSSDALLTLVGAVLSANERKSLGRAFSVYVRDMGAQATAGDRLLKENGKSIHNHKFYVVAIK